MNVLTVRDSSKFRVRQKSQRLRWKRNFAQSRRRSRDSPDQRDQDEGNELDFSV